MNHNAEPTNIIILLKDGKQIAINKMTATTSIRINAFDIWRNNISWLPQLVLSPTHGSKPRRTSKVATSGQQLRFVSDIESRILVESTKAGQSHLRGTLVMKIIVIETIMHTCKNSGYSSHCQNACCNFVSNHDSEHHPARDKGNGHTRCAREYAQNSRSCALLSPPTRHKWYLESIAAGRY